MLSKIIKRNGTFVDDPEWLAEYKENALFFEEDPFAFVSKIADNAYAILSEPKDGTLDVWSYIINGPERALLIDTGFGIGNYKAICDKLTGGRPYDVVITHHHGDHIGGAPWFDAVYCHEYLIPFVESERVFLRRPIFDENGKGLWMDITTDDLVPYKDYELISCEDGHIFDLGGGYEVEFLFTPGHAAGHGSILDRQNRMIFVGDMVRNGHIAAPGHRNEPYEEFNLLEAFTKGIETIVSHADEYDAIYSGHCKSPLPKEKAVDLLKVCREALADPESYDRSVLDPRGNPAYHKDIPGLGYLEYKPDGVRM